MVGWIRMLPLAVTPPQRGVEGADANNGLVCAALIFEAMT